MRIYAQGNGYTGVQTKNRGPHQKAQQNTPSGDVFTFAKPIALKFAAASAATEKTVYHTDGRKVHYISWPDATKEKLGAKAAEIAIEQVLHKPESVFIWPTGNTQIPMYNVLTSRAGVDWKKATFFHLDEYVQKKKLFGLLGSNPKKSELFKTYLDRHFWEELPAEVRPKARHYFASYIKDPVGYQMLVERAEPDMAILGIGQNGHIAFLEPPPGTTVPNSTHQLMADYNELSDPFYGENEHARRIKLAPSTITANFQNPERTGIAEEAVSLGLSTILKAKKILIVANTPEKEAILREALDKGNLDKAPDPSNPASYLRLHRDVTVLTNFSMN